MRYLVFAEEKEVPRYKIAILIKSSAFSKTALEQNYVFPLLQAGIPAGDVIAFTLEYGENGKVSVAEAKSYLQKLLPVLDSLGVTHLYVADSGYFKVMSKKPKADPYLGYLLPCEIPGYPHLDMVLGVNHQAVIYDPKQEARVLLSVETLIKALKGDTSLLGSDIIHTTQYPETYAGIAQALDSLHQYPELTCDIEAFSLRHWLAGVGTISFAWDKHNGIAFACDYKALPAPKDGVYGEFKENLPIRALIKRFFETYKGKLVFHNATYDCKVLIYTLWMASLSDTPGLLTGLEVMTRSLDDTKIIAYLATNSTAGNALGLKALAHSYAGNWSKDDIKEIGRIPLVELLKYNLVDCLSTHFVKERYHPIMVEDQQEQIYHDLFMPSVKLIIQLELTGMPMSAERIQEVKAKLEGMQTAVISQIQGSEIVQRTNLILQTRTMEAANAKLKTKQHPLSRFASVVLNPGSSTQLQLLLYEVLQLPVLDYTESKQPATGADTLKKLSKHTQDQDIINLLKALIDYSKITKILDTFIPAFEKAIKKQDDGIVWLFGSFNLGGTVSGRLSSSDPNLQNLPSGSVFGKLIKSLFMGPEGWVFAGADFSSLEDYISALTTKDPNKLKVYMGHEVFKITINGQTRIMRDDSLIRYRGATYTVKEFFNASH